MEQNETDTRHGSCTTMALVTGVISVVITALLVAGISVIIHVAVYQCIYKPRLTAITDGSAEDRSGGGGDDAIVYDFIDNRVAEMKENYAYGVAKSS